MIFAVAILVGIVFGAADQYLGSLTPYVALGAWTVSVSQMSAPWLLLPFAFGCTQDRPRRAAVLGLVATLAALAGYFAMTVSPMEGVALRQIPHAALAAISANFTLAHPVIVGGLLTGPLFGLAGQRWGVSRTWVVAGLVAGAFLLEPVARLADGQLFGPSWVWLAEVAFGVGLLAWLLVAANAAERGRFARPA